MIDRLNDENDLLYFKSLKPKKKNGFRKFEFICSECKELSVRNLKSITFPFLCKSCKKKLQYKQRPEILEKIKETWVKHHGGIGFASAKVLVKYNETCKRKYGEGVDASKTYSANCKNRKKYLYDNVVFDSSWELAYYIWLRDNNVTFEFHPKTQFTYTDKFGKTHKYNPDFLVGEQFVEIKGHQFLNENGELIDPFTNEICKEKTECLRRNKIIILSKCEKFIKFVKQNYGRNFIKSCRIGENKNEH